MIIITHGNVVVKYNWLNAISTKCDYMHKSTVEIEWMTDELMIKIDAYLFRNLQLIY